MMKKTFVVLTVTGGLLWGASGAAVAAPASDTQPTPAQATAATRGEVRTFLKAVDSAMLTPATVRAARSSRSVASTVAEQMDRPDLDLYPTSVTRTEETVRPLQGDTVRACATWTTTYNTGPASETDTCWDLTIRRGAVVNATPYGTDQILAETPSTPILLPSSERVIPASIVPDGEDEEPGQMLRLNANKGAIAAYARKWAKSTNSHYGRFPQDCTNFVSQAAEAGGWSYKTGWYRSDSVWWFTGNPSPLPRASWTWAGAENWYRFARNESKRAGVITNVWHLNPGDVLQYKPNGAANLVHSMVTTYKNGSDIRLSYHTTDTLNKPLKDIISGDKFFVAHAM